MNRALYAQLQERLRTDDGVDEAHSKLVLAAAHGSASLERLLVSGNFQDAAEVAAPIKPKGVVLKSVSVAGFRGIGPRRTIELKPGPGLTLVLGRNGSGKSSFAEGLEVLLTGDCSRWIGRPKVWREGWQNMHGPDSPEVQAEFLLEGSPTPISIRRNWTSDKLEDGQLASSLTPGWDLALQTYRPFLSYSELAGLVNQEPSKLHDGLSAILGLGDLVECEKVLKEARLPREKEAKICTERAKTLQVRLDSVADTRAVVCRDALTGKKWKLDVIEEQLAGEGSEGLSELSNLRDLASLHVPDVAGVVAQLDQFQTRLVDSQSDRATNALETADLLEQALNWYTRHVIGDAVGDATCGAAPEGLACPVCGTLGALTHEWSSRTTAELERLRAAAVELQQIRRDQADLTRSAQALCAPPPTVLSATLPGFDLTLALERWMAWSAAPSDLVSIRGHLIQNRAALVEAVAPVVEQARTELDKRHSEWKPLALELASWLAQARMVEAERDIVKSLTSAEKWLKKISEDLRNERLQPVAQAAMGYYSQLRQDSNVLLHGIALEGVATQRRVALDVQVDDVGGAALGVMSQGELNALALSLFLPRATLPESPFRFVVIDDPVQAMDPAKVDGLARVLESAARTHQVVVFTHDARLFESVRRQAIDATVISVTRREKSIVELRVDLDPVSRSLSDAADLARTDKIDQKVAARVVPRFCRDAVEAALAEVVRRNMFALGRRHAEIEEQLGQAKTLNKLAALAFCGDSRRVPEAQNRIRNLGGGSWSTFASLNSGAHDAHIGDLESLVRDTRDLVACMRR